MSKEINIEEAIKIMNRNVYLDGYPYTKDEEEKAWETVLKELDYWKTKSSELYVNSIDKDIVEKEYVSKEKIMEQIEKYKEFTDESNIGEYIRIPVLECILEEGE